ncbi:hypothetical protein V2J09_009601 [Rumex salicifolius]
MAAMPPEKSRSLHNFSLPPRLSWGTQRLLRCSKANSAGKEASAAFDGYVHYNRRPRPHHTHDGSSPSSRSRRDPSEPDRKRRSLNGSPVSDEGDRIEVMRGKLMIDLQSEVDKIKNAILVEGGDGEGNSRLPPPITAAAATEDPRPWNLRTRRAACQEPIANGGGDDVRPRFSPPLVKLARGRSDWDGGIFRGEKREREKFSVSLSRQEIEEDFMELIRRRPARKPKKRPKYVQKQLDTLFPGLWLSEITADMYKVDEIPEPMQIMSNDIFKSAVHGAVANS